MLSSLKRFLFADCFRKLSYTDERFLNMLSDSKLTRRSPGNILHSYSDRLLRKIVVCFSVGFFFLSSPESRACTSAIISAERNPYGRPLLWKHRDTSTIDNKVEYVEGKDGEFSFVALFNAADRKLEEAWCGMNTEGFAVMNTASYNIKDDDVPEKMMDREGIVMTLALKSCRTVEDFARLLESLPRPMGVESNFGVIDATGAGAYFEANNHSYVRFDLKDAPDGILIRTNYSHSGRPNEGYGFIREANAEYLLAPFAKACRITPELLTEDVSRNFYHDLYKRDFAESAMTDRWVIDQDFIPRYKSTATIVIEGCVPISGEIPANVGEREYVMWTGLGYPPVAEIVPVTCHKSGVDKSLRGVGNGGHSPASDLAKKRRDDVFPFKKGNGDKYIDMQRLVNDEGTGYIQVIVRDNLKVYENTRRQRGGNEK